jgi:hypothetical protein
MANDQDSNASIGLAEKKIVGEPPQIRPLVTTDSLVEMLGVFSDL